MTGQPPSLPLSDWQRLVVGAVYQLNRSATPEEAETNLQRTHGYASPENVAMAMIAGEDARELANDFNEPWQLVVTSDEPVALPSTTFNQHGFADVLFTDPDNPDVSIQVRVIISPGDTYETLIADAVELGNDALTGGDSDHPGWNEVDESHMQILAIYLR